MHKKFHISFGFSLNFIFYTIRMRTNRIIRINSGDSSCSEPGRAAVSRESLEYCLSGPSCSKAKPCSATPDNITNSLLSCRGHINLENIKNNETRRVGRLLCPPDPAFVIDEPTKNRYYRLNKRMWRNWQTRRLQEPVGSTPWRFDSSHPHYLAVILAGSPH